MAREGMSKESSFLTSPTLKFLPISENVLFASDDLWAEWFYGFWANLTLSNFFCLNGAYCMY